MAQVGNKNIDNASGQVVRLDIQNTIAAVASNNFGSKASAGEIQPAEFVADSSTNPKQLLIRSTSGSSAAASATFFSVGNLDEDNLGLLPKAGGTMTGNILGHEGSGSSGPSYAFDTDSDTGMYRVGANTLGFSTAGALRVDISDAGLATNNGLPLKLQSSSSNNYVSLKASSSLSSNVNLTLPTSVGNAGEVLQSDGSGTLSFAVIQGVPTGAVFCMAVATVPSAYLECNGAAVSRTTYAALFAVIGTQYGSGNGSSTFNIPDLRGEFVRGYDHGRGADTGRNIASSQSGDTVAHTHAYSNSSLTLTGGNHAHQIRRITLNNNNGSVNITLGSGQSYNVGYANNDSALVAANNAVKDSGNISVTGTLPSINATGSESRPRNIAMMYVIKV